MTKRKELVEDWETGEVVEKEIEIGGFTPAGFKVAGQYDTNAESDKSAIYCADPSLAIQEQKDDADINTIVRRFGITGELPLANRVPLPDGVFYDSIDYRDCFDVVNAAQKSFASLPANVRARFQNDPALFVDFAEDPANLDECVKLGLAPAKVVESSSQTVAPAV